MLVVVAGCSAAPGAPRGGDSVEGETTREPLTASPEAVGPPRATHLVLGYEESCAVLANGELACWGRDDDGQLGDGAASGAPHSFPLRVATLTGVVGAAPGSAQICSVLASGSASCWGDGFFGELGNGARAASLVPQPVMDLGSVVSLAAADGFGCAVAPTGTVACWGTDALGQLGDDGALSLSTTPIAVAGVSGAAAVAAGESHACALLLSGAVTCWGGNGAEQLGADIRAGQSGPVTVAGVTDAVAIAAGVAHTCTLEKSGSVLCWGAGASGALGGGPAPAAPATAGPSSPSLVRVAGLTDAVALAAGGYETCALRAGGGVVCWGKNDSGQLGDGTTLDSATPVGVEGLFRAVEVAVGDGHACARSAAGSLACWGSNAFGQLGDGTTTTRLTATPVAPLP
jgi:alpha-tubulin suppressor-like RCC1 family protein